MNTLWLDIETFSPVVLPMTGPFVYAENFELLVNAWAWNDHEVVVEESITSNFMACFRNAHRIVAHNAEFDRTCLSKLIADIRFEAWDCTMAAARRHALPGGLGTLCEVLGVPLEHSKMKMAHDDLMFFCKPNKDGTRNTKATHPERWARFLEYASLDVVAMREVAKRTPTWNNAHERAIWLADQRINARGFAVDLDYVDKAIALLKTEGARLDAQAVDMSEGALNSARQRDAFLAHLLEAHGAKLHDLKADTIERRLRDENLPEGLRDLLVLRQQSSKTSTSKYATFKRVTCADGRARGTETYCGAKRTKRWNGNRVQPLNMRRPGIGKLRGEALRDEIRHAVRAVKAGVFLEWAEYPTTEVLASTIRGAIVAAPGNALVIADWSNIEGRKVAWLAGEDAKLAAFRAYDDGTGPDLYRKAYSDAFGIPVEDVDEFMRQVGKVMELMLGFGGGVGAFVTGAATYRIELADLVRTAWPAMPEDVKEETAGMWEWAGRKHRRLGLPEPIFRTCDGLKRLWRRRHPAIEAYWSDPVQGTGAEEVVRRVLESGKPEQCGRVWIEKWRTWLKVQLPSGSWLSYPGAQVKDDGTLRFLGENPYTKRWGWTHTYGGKLVENWTQASSRDALADTLVDFQDTAVLHVHDEPVLEVPRHEADAVLAALIARMKVCAWAPGLPLAVKGYITDRYEKEA